MLSLLNVRKALPAALVVTSIVAAAPGGAAGQEGCVLGDGGRNDTFIQTLPGMGRVTYIGGPHFACAGGVDIFADSAVAYAERGMSHLIGSVRYVEEGRELRAAEARYFTNEGRLQAQGDVIVLDREQGSSIRDGDLVYLLQTDFREVSEMVVTVGGDGVRPRAVLTPPLDSAQADTLATPEPYTVDANRIFLRGSGYFSASGDVVIERDSLFAYADSAEYDEGAEGLTLVDDARVVGTGYELTGRTIVMANPGGDASEVRALREARLLGTDLLLTAARIVVLLQDGDLHRLVATTLARPDEAEPDSLDLQRPEALVGEFVLTADSLSVSAPKEQIQRVFAAGRARSVSTAQDSLNTEALPEIARKDWLEGDTVIVRFVGSPPVPPLMSAQQARDSAVASGSGEVAADSTLARVDSTLARVDSTLAGADSTLAGADSTQAGADSMLAGADSTLASVDSGAIAADSTAARDLTSALSDTTGVATDPAPATVDPIPASAAAGSPGEAAVEEIIARVNARSLYRLPPNDTTYEAGTDPPAVHYVMGTEIRIRLESGEVRGMKVTGQTRGVHLEPLRRAAPIDTTAVPGDTTGLAVDTVGLAVDTVGVAVDTMGVAVDTLRVTMVAVAGSTSGPSPHRTDDPNENDRKGNGGAVRLEKEYPWNHR